MTTETKIIKIYGDYKFAVSKNSNNPEVAKEFLRYIFEESRYAKAVNNISPLKEENDRLRNNISLSQSEKEKIEADLKEYLDETNLLKEE